MQNAFYEPRQKIERAKQHIDELDKAIKAFVSTDFCRIGVEEDAKTGEYVLNYKMTKPVPESIPLIIGDAIHNVHSALDIMLCNIVRSYGGTAKYTKFPFFNTKEDLIAALQGSEIGIAWPQITSLVVDTIKSYRGGNDFLYALHDLDIDDKHKFLLPVISITALTNVTGTAGGVTQIALSLLRGIE
ncbi:MAG: hypothetical protein M1347_04795 [Chloroflexi bacterium]|nr:hypothetical protein [Chloroflexota bacterium]